jgi:hypothetical protein
MSSNPTEGGCLCRSVRYRITSEPLAQALCHCRSCRLAAGAPAVAWIVVNRSDFAFVGADPMRFRSSPDVIRTFCGRCGTPLTYQHDDSPDTIDVTAATLDLPDAFPPAKEIWVEHRIAWMPANARLPQYPRNSKPAASDV